MARLALAMAHDADARLGRASEADEAGVPLEDVSDAGHTHTNKKTSLRYLRRRSKRLPHRRGSHAIARRRR